MSGVESRSCALNSSREILRTSSVHLFAVLNEHQAQRGTRKQRTNLENIWDLSSYLPFFFSSVWSQQLCLKMNLARISSLQASFLCYFELYMHIVCRLYFWGKLYILIYNPGIAETGWHITHVFVIEIRGGLIVRYIGLNGKFLRF
jgi:hypothetical protein